MRKFIAVRTEIYRYIFSAFSAGMTAPFYLPLPSQKDHPPEAL